MKLLKIERALEARIPTNKQSIALLRLYNTSQQIKEIDEDLANEMFSSLIEQLDLRGHTLSTFFAEVEAQVSF